MQNMRVVNRIPRRIGKIQIPRQYPFKIWLIHPIKQTNSNELNELNEFGQTDKDTDTDKQEAANRAGKQNIRYEYIQSKI